MSKITKKNPSHVRVVKQDTTTEDSGSGWDVCSIARRKLEDYQIPRNRLEGVITHIYELVDALKKGGFDIRFKEIGFQRTSERLMYDGIIIFEGQHHLELSLVTRVPKPSMSQKTLSSISVDLTLTQYPLMAIEDEFSDELKKVSNTYRLETADAQINRQNFERQVAELAGYYKAYAMDQERAEEFIDVILTEDDIKPLALVEK